VTRREILEQIQTTIGVNGVGRFCYECGAPGVQVEVTSEGEIFVCDANGHRSARAFFFDGKAMYAFENGELVHDVVGAVIRRGSGETRQTLLFLRRKFPFLYTIPAGHQELGTEPEAEMGREVSEETGLTIVDSSLLWNEQLVWQDACRRGADIHRWHVFEVSAHGAPRLSDEGRIIGWYRDDEIKELARQNLLTQPVQAIFARLGVLS
jgi:ADP-ribose pyrophosphatase YjhB (NUDIX family)